MKKCNKCGFTTENSEMNFCVNCGNKMTEINDTASGATGSGQTCRNCGFANKSNVKFCIKCGAPFADKKVDLSKKAAPIREVFPEKSAEEIYPSERNKPSAPENTGDLSNYTVPAAPKKSNGGIIAACTMIAAFIVVAVLVFVIPRNSEDNLASEEISETMTDSETTETMTMTTMTETVTEKAAETTSATTTVKETTVTETEADEEEMNYDDERPTYFSFSGGSISLDENNRYFKSYFSSEEEYHVSYCGYVPHVSINGNASAGKKIEDTLKSMLGFDDNEMTEIDGDSVEMSYPPQYNFGDIIIEKRVEQVYCENGMLFVTVGVCSDYGGGTSSSIFYYEDALIFNTADGEQRTLSDLITDKQGFFNAVNGYMEDLIYYNTYGGGTDEFYTYSGDDYEAMISELESDSWITGEWDYDGNTLNVLYYYLLGSGFVYKTTEFNIPKDVWAAYVDISPNAKADYSNVDSLGKKIMSGNTAGNYSNDSAYCFDSENVYFAGGIDGYHWRLYKASIGSTYENGTMVTDDMTDYVIVDGDTLYYRNANDGYKLYSIGTDGSGRKRLTDYKVTNFRLYDGKIYLAADDNQLIYRINKDGTEKTKIYDDAISDLQIYDDRIYAQSPYRNCIMYCDMSGKYIGDLIPSYFGIKQFIVSDGYCVCLCEEGVSIINIDTREETTFEIYTRGIGLNEDKKNYYIVTHDDNSDSLYRIPKNDVENVYYIGDFDFHYREFYTVYDDNSTYIYILDEDGAATCIDIYN